MLCNFRSTGFLLAVVLGCCGLARAQEVSGIQVLSIGGVDGELSGELAEKIAGSAASMSFGGFASGGAISSLGGVDPNDASQLFNLLSNASVRAELKLSEDQYSGVKQIQQASQKRMSEMFRSKMQAKPVEGGQASFRLNGSDFQKMQQENREQAEAAVEEILLPEQMKRLRQLAYQVEVTQEGLGESLVAGRLGKEIGVYEDQKSELADRAAKIEAEAQAEINKIRSAARAKLLGELAPEQRKAAEELLGAFFDYQEVSLADQMRKNIKEMMSKRENATENPKQGKRNDD